MFVMCDKSVYQYKGPGSFENSYFKMLIYLDHELNSLVYIIYTYYLFVII